MREIKFRGKVKYNGNHKFSGDWIYGYYRNNENGNAFITETLDEMENYIFDETEIDEETIGQYTGLKDKNGKEIYEGDILKFKMYDGKYENYKIVFRNAEFEAINEDDTNFISTDIWNVYGEVIGNIWEDSDLLNDSKNTETN